MTEVKLRYVRKKGGNLFWEPTAEMRALGFLPKPLGPDGPRAHAEAVKLYQGWQQARVEQIRVTTYPDGSFGGYWDRLRGARGAPSPWWTKKKNPRTREDYLRAWANIDKWRHPETRTLLSHFVVTEITTEICEAFFAHLEATVSPNERWRTFKCFKVLMSDVVVRLRLGYDSPAAKIENPLPKGRSSIWLGAEIPQLVAGAEELGYGGMAVAIRIAWDTLFAPIDVWTIRSKQALQDGAGWYVHRQRTKTLKEAFGALSEATAAALWAHVAAVGIEVLPETPLIRQRNGNAYRSKDTFGDDFRAVRGHVFPGDTRQFMDIRRSGNVEADAAGADKKTMGEILANGLADSSFLDETYTPATVTKAREVATQRLAGRAALAGEIDRIRKAQ